MRRVFCLFFVIACVGLLCRRAWTGSGSFGIDHPAVYALELLPLYDAVARVKTHEHWQNDVLVGWAIGTAVGVWAAHRQSPLIPGWLPHGFAIGYVHRF